jgi:hypothetical protein
MIDPNSGQSLFEWFMAGVSTVVAWFVKSTRDDTKEHSQKISKLQLEQAQLIGRVEFHAEMSEIRREMMDARREVNNNFDKVFEKLDKKADKS